MASQVCLIDMVHSKMKLFPSFYPQYIAGHDDPESEDELYEVVDLTEYARRHQWWSRVFGSNSGPLAEKYSVTTQLVMGGVTGW